MSITITSPIDGYQGRSTFGPVTVDFVDGVAEVDTLSDGLRAYLTGHGYGVGEAVEVPEGVPVEKWTHAQLDAYAAELGREPFKSNTSKADKVAALVPPSGDDTPPSGDDTNPEG